MSFLNHIKADCPPLLKSFEVIDRETNGEYHDDIIEDYTRNNEFGGYEDGNYLLGYIQGKSDQDPSSPASTEHF